MVLEELEKEILALCADDDTELWLIIKRISKDSYSFTTIPETDRQKTMTVLRRLLENNIVNAGFLQGSNFEILSLSVDETIAYIEAEWDKLGKTPNMGDICWFRATPKGEKLAHELDLI